ncbi:methyltransferase domain-containing protein [Amycolatopsis sp. EV170708-02-1]|uniref:methyltransferase domain-containing protein n=1 Tax=Amycolatopsis sp. EV170708-02-1 TaxID=2919322 RepID=UPI001F0C0B77|nr:methyltransferase domain-containing protein [Amycolatopsis sp. EV170708-02-1]UMP04796.1 methyltransferase domain-containing protein [Amycolatopsis sp. EV170708-02-1]
MTAVTTPWRERARRLADELAAEGVLRAPEWRAAIEAVPRHAFVPRFHTQQPDGKWSETGADSPDWLDQVYRNQPLITALASTPRGSQVTVSSSTKPGLMIRMLEALRIDGTHRVLEIGTGTGYNAGLLTHRLGDDQVCSVDIAAEQVAAARARLHELDLRPTLAVGHGGAGLPGEAPFDRIIATCSVSAVPSSWVEQVRDGGLVLVDLKRTVHAGNLVLLTRHGDRLEGRFLPRWAGFMAMRESGGAPPDQSVDITVEVGDRSTTGLPPHPWDSLIPWLLAQSSLPSGLTFGYRGTGAHRWAVFTANEGSWCAVAVNSSGGRREVRQHGEVRIWDEFEKAHDQWRHLAEPGWGRFGLTVTADGGHRIWLDDPDGAHSWPLAPIRQ